LLIFHRLLPSLPIYMIHEENLTIGGGNVSIICTL
jgi:hypothetical protein